ncbi:hypothetical protein B0T22DRAFT_436641 [Podospora appendiculata]|uniref:Uncharacterized protein n=1 Tax=Podospora appendiculata TaxID=314037 RepID=A0AAE1CG80_9PEZI|nr:hypothetical protein B0T22DRAFT_436641 [Podospora appendiculata]
MTIDSPHWTGTIPVNMDWGGTIAADLPLNVTVFCFTQFQPFQTGCGPGKTRTYNLPPRENFTADTFASPRFRLPPDALSASLAAVTTLTSRGRLNCTFIKSRCTEVTIPSFFANSSAIPCNRRTLTVPETLFQRQDCPQLPPPATLTRLAGGYDVCRDPGAAILSSMPTDNRTALLTSDPRALVGYFWMPVTGDYEAVKSDVNWASDCPAILPYGRDVPGDCAAGGMSFAPCSPYLEIAYAEVVFTLPDLGIRNVTISSDRPRVPVHPYGKSEYLERWQTSLFRANKPSLPQVITSKDLTMLSDVFKEITTTTSGVLSIDDLRSTDPAARSKVFDALETLWGQTMARVARDNLTTTTSFEQRYHDYFPVNVTLMSYARRRVVQNEASTRILQGLLAAMLASIVVGFAFGSRGLECLVPLPPTRIGAVWWLLAGSRILGRRGGDGVEGTDGPGGEGFGGEDDGGRITCTDGRRRPRYRVPGNGILPEGCVALSDEELRREVFKILGGCTV